MTRILFFPTLLALACNPPSQSNENESAPPPPPKPGPLDQTYEAHGGLNQWQSYRSLSLHMSYERGGEIREETILTDLQTRQERIEGSDYVLGYDGNDYWEKLPDGVKTRNPKFQIGLQFYFFALPFVQFP